MHCDPLIELIYNIIIINNYYALKILILNKFNNP